jgi:hypothetical protein
MQRFKILHQKVLHQKVPHLKVLRLKVLRLKVPHLKVLLCGHHHAAPKWAAFFLRQVHLYRGNFAQLRIADTVANRLS